MTDIVERLRNGVYGTNRIPLCAEAAEEIERLREHAVILAATTEQGERERCALLANTWAGYFKDFQSADEFAHLVRLGPTLPISGAKRPLDWLG